MHTDGQRTYFTTTDHTNTHSSTMLSSTTLAVLSFLILSVSLILYLLHLFILHPLSFIRHYQRQHIPGDPFVPVVGQAFAYLASHSANSRLQLAHNKAKEHGLLYYTTYGRHVRLILNDPAFLLPLLRNRTGTYEKTSNGKKLLEPLIGQHSLFVSSEPLHGRKKKLLTASLHQLNLPHMLTLVQQETDGRLDELADRLDAAGGAVELEVHEFVSRITLAVICQLALGSDSSTVAASFPSLCYSTFNRVLSLQQQRSLSLWESLPLLDRLPFHRKREVDRLCHTLHAIVNTAVAHKRQATQRQQVELTTQQSGGESKERKDDGWAEERGRWKDYVCSDPVPEAEHTASHSDLLSLLLASNASTTEPLWQSDQEMSEELLAFILAGHESITNLITWTVYLLLKHPSALAALHIESAAYPPTQPHSLLSLSTSSRPVLDAVLMESLRLYPPAPILLRQTQHATTLKSLDRRTLHLPAHAIVVSNAHVIHRQRAVWGDTADDFRFERWMERRRGVSGGGSESGDGRELFVPFGVGGRTCMGMSVALLEAKAVLLAMVERMDMKLCEGQQVVPDIKLTMKPKHGLRVLAKVRANN